MSDVGFGLLSSQDPEAEARAQGLLDVQGIDDAGVPRPAAIPGVDLVEAARANPPAPLASGRTGMAGLLERGGRAADTALLSALPPTTQTAVREMAGIVPEFTPAGDVKDIKEGASKVVDSVLNGDPQKALLGAAEAASGAAGFFVPGSGAIKAGAEAAAQGLLGAAGVAIPAAAKRAANDAGAASRKVDALLEQSKGAAPDRTDYTLVRARPAKGFSSRVSSALAGLRNNRGGLKDQLLDDIKRGLDAGGADWYNTEALRNEFVKRLGEKRGHDEWREFMWLMGAASTGARVPENIRIASYYRNLGPERIQKHLAELQEGAPSATPGELAPGGRFGHQKQRNHMMNVANIYGGRWGVDPEPGLAVSKASSLRNPKPRGFAQSLMGSGRNIAADLHFTRYMAMASQDPDWLENSAQISAGLAKRLRDQYGGAVDPYLSMRVAKNGQPVHNFKAKKAVKDGPVELLDIADEPTVYVGRPADNEYAAFEDYINELGKELGLTGPQVQAAMWMGAADKTNVAQTSQDTFTSIFNERVRARAQETGQTPRKVLDEFISNRGLLSAAGAGAGGAVAAGSLLGGPEGEGSDPGSLL